MSELVITPDFSTKTARIVGTASAGEKVSVTIKNAAELNTSTLRLRVLFGKKLVAVFPIPVAEGESQDTFSTDGDDLVCTLNLCTDTALKVFRRIPELEALFVLDDIGSSVRQMYFRDTHEVLGWPLDVADAPIDLSGYKDRMQELAGDIDDMQETLDSAIESMQTTLDGKVDKVGGKGLSTLDVTSDMLSAFATDAQLQAHVNDTTRHISSAERTAWSALVGTKQDVIVSDGYLYAPGVMIGDNRLWYRLNIQYDNEMHSITTVVGETKYIRNSDGEFVEYVTDDESDEET